MNKSIKIPIFLLRLTLGWIFFYAGITKILNPEWSAAAFLQKAKTFPLFFQWLANSQNIDWVNFLNSWGPFLIGISLILGALVRWSSLAGILLMILYYLPAFDFPYAGSNSYLIDQHIIYILVLLLLYRIHAGQIWGLDAILRKTKAI